MDTWPCRRRFDRCFGIPGRAANCFTPVLASSHTSYNAPADFYLTGAVADTAARFIGRHFAEKEKK